MEVSLLARGFGDQAKTQGVHSESRFWKETIVGPLNRSTHRLESKVPVSARLARTVFGMGHSKVGGGAAQKREPHFEFILSGNVLRFDFERG
jgi:hypothetical protein